MMKKAELVSITPEVAHRFLEKNYSNRNLSPSVVNKYAKDMLSGDWGVPTTIIFDKQGNLIDGQHRLNAVIKSNCQIEFIVLTDEDSKVGIDRGRLRSTPDALIMNGLKKSVANNSVVGAVKFLYVLERHPDGGATDSMIEKYVREYEEELSDAYAIAYTKSAHPISRKASVICAIYCALRCGVDRDELFECFEVVNSGFCDNSDKYSAIVLRNYMLNNTCLGWDNRKKLTSVTEQAIRDWDRNFGRRRPYDVSKFVYSPIVIEEDIESKIWG